MMISVWNRTIRTIGTIGTIGFKKTEKLSDQKPSDSRSDSPIVLSDRKPKMLNILFKRLFMLLGCFLNVFQSNFSILGRNKTIELQFDVITHINYVVSSNSLK